MLPALDDWLAQAFTPNHLATTIERLFASQPDHIADSDDLAVSRTIADCDAKLARYREALEAGEIRALVDALGNISVVLASADPEDKAEVYRQPALSSSTSQPTGSSARKPG